MRRLALLATLAVPALMTAGCSYKVDDCDQPEEPFELELELEARDVDRLKEENEVIDANSLKCESVCASIYLDENPMGSTTTVYNCTLTFDGDFNGDPNEIVGSVQCDGLGVPQFCK